MGEAEVTVHQEEGGLGAECTKEGLMASPAPEGETDLGEVVTETQPEISADVSFTGTVVEVEVGIRQ